MWVSLLEHAVLVLAGVGPDRRTFRGSFVVIKSCESCRDVFATGV